LDVAANYGWFIRQFTDMGFEAHGVERDPTSIRIGQFVYSNPIGAVTRADAVAYLRDSQILFDVVSCFSLVHHFVLGRGSVSADVFLQLLARRTGKVLFFDMGQSHEEWFKDSLRGWDASFIARWLAEQTGFRITPLGTDEDAVGPFSRNYGRTLFACERV
jgi:hypothetical protein